MKPIKLKLPRPRKTVKPAKKLIETITVRLNEKTIVKMKATSFYRWKEKYPEAVQI